MTPRSSFLTNELVSEAVSWRRHLHQQPELAFEEYKTADSRADNNDVVCTFPVSVVDPWCTAGFHIVSRLSPRHAVLRDRLSSFDSLEQILVRRFELIREAHNLKAVVDAGKPDLSAVIAK